MTKFLLNATLFVFVFISQISFVGAFEFNINNDINLDKQQSDNSLSNTAESNEIDNLDSNSRRQKSCLKIRINKNNSKLNLFLNLYKNNPLKTLKNKRSIFGKVGYTKYSKNTYQELSGIMKNLN